MPTSWVAVLVAIAVWIDGSYLSAISIVDATKAYPWGCIRQDRSYYDYDHSMIFPPPNIPLKSTNDYLLVSRLGAGKFSDVFEAVDQQLENQLHVKSSNHTIIDPRTLVVLKCLKPVAQRKIMRELLVLQHASKLPNLARLLAIVLPFEESYSTYTASGGHISNNDINNKYRIQSMPTLVLEHAFGDWLCHPNRKQIQQQVHVNNETEITSDFLSEDEIRYYIFHLLIALDSLHSCGIMHRDVKPRNVIINRTKQTLMLIDLGLADFYLPQIIYDDDNNPILQPTNYNVRVATRHYKSPELLLGYQEYDYSIDMWGVGCILAGLLFHKEPFFRGKDNLDQLAAIVNVLGTTDLHLYMSKYHIPLTSDIREVITKCTIKNGGSKREWTSFIPTISNQTSINNPSFEGIDLVSKLLRYDHDERLTAQEAMQHPFFDTVRTQVLHELSQRQHQQHFNMATLD